MYFGIFTLFTALTISVIAAWYSIIGLTAIFAAAFVPIIVMGGSLEVGKVVTAVWLKLNWTRANSLMKTYLITATVVLMLITSMGIFGFLSKAHVEQTAASTESVALIAQYEKEITRQNEIVDRSRNKIIQLETAGSSTDSNFQEQIDKEQIRIDSAYDRIKPAIKEQNDIIASQTKLYKDQIASLETELKTLQDYIDAGEIKKAQQLIGEKSKGGWGPKTSETARLWRLERTTKRAALFAKIEDISNSSDIIAARAEITRLRQSAENQIAQSNKLIDRLRGKIGSAEIANVDDQVNIISVRISTATATIEEFTTKKYALEGEYRKLEAEVGPVKYIAEFVYGEKADREMLEEAVKWVIIMLIFVFDPLAICLILAGVQQIKWSLDEKKTLSFAGRVVVDDGEVVTDFQEEDFVKKHLPEEFIIEKPEPSPFELYDEEVVFQPTEEPEPSVTNIAEEPASIVDSIDQMQSMMIDQEPAEIETEEEYAKKEEPVIKVDTPSSRQAALQKKAKHLDEERKKVIQEIHDDDANSNNTLPPRTVARAADVPQVGKPFVKDHK